MGARVGEVSLRGRRVALLSSVETPRVVALLLAAQCATLALTVVSGKIPEAVLLLFRALLTL